jgi:hypothetical protein
MIHLQFQTYASVPLRGVFGARRWSGVFVHLEFVVSKRAVLCLLLGWWLKSVKDSQIVSSTFTCFGNCLTQEEEVHRTQEAEGKAYPVGILGDGSQEVDLAFLVAQMASGLSQRQVDPLWQGEIGCK